MKRFRKLTAMLCALCMSCVLAAAISVAPVNASTIGMNIIKDPTVRNSSLTTWNAGWEAYGAIHKFSTESHTDDGSGSISVEHPSGVVTSSHCSTTVELVENAKYRYSVWIKAENIEIITHNGNGGGTALLLVALLAVACLLFKKKAA